MTPLYEFLDLCHPRFWHIYHQQHFTVSHSKSFVDRRTKNHINGIEGFWSYAKHILYNYRGVSKYHFPMYLKEIE